MSHHFLPSENSVTSLFSLQIYFQVLVKKERKKKNPFLRDTAPSALFSLLNTFKEEWTPMHIPPQCTEIGLCHHCL